MEHEARNQSLKEQQQQEQQLKPDSSSSEESDSRCRRRRKRRKHSRRHRDKERNHEKHRRHRDRSKRHKEKKRKHQSDGRSSRNGDPQETDESSSSSSYSEYHIRVRKKRRSKSKRRKRHKRKKDKRSYSYSSSSSSSSDSDESPSHVSDRRGKPENPLRMESTTVERKGHNPSDSERIDTTTRKVLQPTTTMKKRAANAMVPMTKEEYDREQSKIREVYDPLSGRVRLVRGSGEIIERIVSSESHKQINSTATLGDGYAFSKGIFDKARRR